TCTRSNRCAAACAERSAALSGPHEAGDDGHVVRWLVGPAAGGVDDFGADGALGDVGGGPDMVQAPAPVRFLPVEAAIALPAIELLVIGHVLAHQVDPAMASRQ